MEEEDEPENRKSAVALRVRNLQRHLRVATAPLRAFLRQVAAELNVDGGATTLVLVSDERMRALNRVFRDRDLTTDVLSFPAERGLTPDEESYLGDIVISAETARRQALRRKSNLPRELKVLTLHGFLHLLGYDHETDNGEMRRIEYRLRRKLGITRKRSERPASSKQKTRKKR